MAEENLQARVRGNLLMALSNRFGSLVLATGNKSEYAVGYATLYGDMAGGFAPVKDVPKTVLYDLARWRNGQEPTRRSAARARQAAVGRAPTRPTGHGYPAALRRPRPDHRGLRGGRRRAGGHHRSPRARPVLVERVVAMIDGAEYKRRQAAPGIKITPKAFGRDRRLPITNRYRTRLSRGADGRP